MLEELRKIVQEVNAASDLQAALDIIVRSVRSAMGTEVCTVYLYDTAKEQYIFRANEGLNQDLIGKVGLAKGEGLVGKVAKREETINIDNAEQNPAYRYMPGIGEENFKAFMGVPIIHRRKVLGVLVVQQQAPRRFDESEESFLVTMSAQLAALIAHADASGAMIADVAGGTAIFHGVAGSEGIAIGEVVVVVPPADLDAVPNRKCEDPEVEIEFFNQSLAAVRADIKDLSENLATLLPREEHALFDVYLGMLDDKALGDEVTDLIRGGEWAQGAISQVMRTHARAFEMLDDAYLRERAVDIKDLGRRVLAYLQESGDQAREYPEKTILIGEELTASALAEVPEERLAGLVSVRGSRNSHLAIMARALGVPTVVGAEDLPYTRLDNQQVIVDGSVGEVICNAPEDLRQHYEKLQAEDLEIAVGLEELKDKPCESLDGHRLPLVVNTGLVSEVARSLDRGAEGVGLYRTEILFLLRDRFPSEEEQRQIYREQLEAFYPKPVTMRTLDIGGDKALPYFPISEENPFLGWRGIRVTLDHPEIYLAQIRAMMKANADFGNLRIMLPMISNVMELEEALELLYRAHEELLEEGYKMELPPVGVMIEVPAAVYQAREFARRVDFLSVGSNDLTQYLLAVDRNNPRVADLYHAYHPAVLRALKIIVDGGHAEGKPVSICGELAGDPGAAVLLMAMGFDVLSMSAYNLPKVKAVIRQITKAQAVELLNSVLELENNRDIEEKVNETLAQLGVIMPSRVKFSG
jgi:phosphotransferase system enzyme I (PtsP)|tara:strand:- start:1406 stop:3667 length:2262 start_codon:yes stop_codon:yes gene_type:complete